MKKSLNYFFSRVKELKEKGKKILVFTLTSPEFEPPPLKEKILNLYPLSFSYSPAGGDFTLRETLAKFYSAKWQKPLKKENTFVGAGEKEILFILLNLILEKGGEVVIVSPNWPSYPRMVEMAKGRVKFFKTSEKEGFYLKTQELKKVISAKTKAVIINSPANPTGKALREKDVKFLANLALKKNFLLIADEVYEIYDYENHYCSFLKYFNKNIFCVFSASKIFSLCGWRTGWGFGREKLIKQMINYQFNLSTSPHTLSQLVIREIFKDPEGISQYFLKTEEEARKRRDLAINFLREKKVAFILPEGGIAIFIKIPSSFKNAFSFCETLLNKELVSVAPGEIFGEKKYFRMNLAVSLANLNEGLKRIAKYY
ncbi:MAG: hypothetical protein COT33_00740 [Candidatus Nealsonbacteria bacterium CG08_land_8_20_14_0_20_38_20]|uniref:Aminotransferase class I/classII large domain-containing protein n=1 Tax=Candidatus Nealsonbacteria bacterium CG08_land_8_20_14_0_20_38_20 TaxID=1974705 RepID=A0A2H0YME6_9BACT|nr:MAG: hypothetical protein COT33_00740 [Candidatus Nealsonbacteria bacterium CG08_land_8_20_14_0_20_38_20]